MQSIRMTLVAPHVNHQKIIYRMMALYQVILKQLIWTQWKKNLEMMLECIRKPCIIIIRRLFTRLTHRILTVLQTPISSLQRNILLQPKQPKEPQLIRKWRGQYSVGNNIDGCCLYRDNLVVVAFEEVFDIIREAHTKISHMIDAEKNKKVINEDLGYHGVPKSCVQFFIDTCPLVHKVFE